MYNILFSSHFLNRIFYKIAAQGLVVSVTFCYRTEEVRSAVNYIHLTVLLYFIDVVFKGIVQPFELGGETRLIRSDVKK